MGTRIFQTLIVAALCLSALSTQAQTAEKVITAGIDTTIGKMVFGAYDIATDTYEPFDTVTGDFSNDVLVDGDFVYILAGQFGNNDNFIYKYNARTFEKLDSVNVIGALRLAIVDDQLIVGKGFPTTAGFVDFYNKNDLTLIRTDNTQAFNASPIGFANGKAYIATGYFSGTDSTRVYVYDLATHAAESVITLDTTIKDVRSLYYDDGKLYLIGRGFLQIVDLQNSTYTTEAISHGSTCFGDPGLGLFNGKIYYGTTADDIKAYDIATGVESSVSTYSGCFNRGAWDPYGGTGWVLSTDFFSQGTVVEANQNGLQPSFAPGIGGESITILYEDTVDVAVTELELSLGLSVYPNPATDYVQVSLNNMDNQVVSLSLLTVDGREIEAFEMTSNQQVIEMSSLANGVYMLRIQTNEGSVVRKIMKY